MTREISAKRPSAGFSALELMVVVALAGVLLAVAWARLSHLAPKSRLEGVARSLDADLQKARGRAIAEGRCFQVTLNVGAKTYQVNSKAGAATCGTTGFAADPTDGALHALDDVNSVTVGVSANPVFDPRGKVS